MSHTYLPQASREKAQMKEAPPPAQTLCPYLVKALSSVSPVNGEHIVPAGIGAPESFTVQAAAEQNSRMNEEIDEPFLNEPFVRFLAGAEGAVSRSGPVRAILDGKIIETNELIRGRFTSEGVSPMFVKPVTKDSSGDVMVRGFGDEGKEIAAKIQAARVAAGERVQIPLERKLENPRLEFSTNIDLLVVARELIKAAYLMTVRTFGDEAIISKSGQVFRAALAAKTIEEIRATGLLLPPIPGLMNLPPEFRTSARNELSLTTLLLPKGLATSVSLFGFFNGLFGTPLDGFSCPLATGTTVVIDARTRKITLTLSNVLPCSELARALNLRPPNRGGRS